MADDLILETGFWPAVRESFVAASCTGDCNGDQAVTVDEIVTMVNIALGLSSMSACEAGDSNGDGKITIDETLQAVDNALYGCKR